MTLYEKINADLKNAMREKRELEVSTLRMLISAMSYKMIQMSQAREKGLPDEQVIEMVQSEIKKRKDSITSYEEGGRNDLAEKEKSELEILVRYMPEQMGDEELAKIVREIASGLGEISAKDFGKVMGQVMSRVKGKTDGNKVSAMVKKVLES